MLDHDAGAAREQWYGAQEAARFLGVHRSTLHIAVRHGLIVPDAYTPGHHARFKRETLEAFRAHLAEHPATSDSGAQTSLRALAQIAGMLVQPSEPEELASAVIAGIRRVLPQVDMCCVAVRSGDPRDRFRMRLLAEQDFPNWVIDDYIRMRSTFRFATTAALRSLHPQICEDTASEQVPAGTEHLLRSLHVGAYIVQPILAGDEPLGVLICACKRPHTFGDTERTFITGISNELASALANDGRFRQLTDALTTSRVLMRHALLLRADVARRAPRDGKMVDGTVGEGQAPEQMLRDVFLHLSGADEVCALGFGRDLPTTNRQLLMLACEACAGDEMAHAQWTANGIPYTGVGTSVPLATGQRAGVSAAWPGRRPLVDADYALLVTFAGAYVVATDVR